MYARKPRTASSPLISTQSPVVVSIQWLLFVTPSRGTSVRDSPEFPMPAATLTSPTASVRNAAFEKWISRHVADCLDSMGLRESQHHIPSQLAGLCWIRVEDAEI